jgi:ABC-type molybdate transport system ATPase subunit
LRLTAGAAPACAGLGCEPRFELSGASATLNILPAPIVAAVAQDGAQMNVVLRLGAAGPGVALLARVTRKCWVTLGLRPGA